MNFKARLSKDEAVLGQETRYLEKTYNQRKLIKNEIRVKNAQVFAESVNKTNYMQTDVFIN